MSRDAECPYCGHESRIDLIARDRNRRFEGSFSYFKCLSCRLLFIGEIPTNLEMYYGGGYQPIPGSPEELRRLARREAFRVDEVTKHVASGKLLEIGPWIGIFSVNAMERGFDVHALEFNKACVDLLNASGVVATQTADPARAIGKLGSFDVIALWHSLEHLPNPWDVLSEAARHVKPGGILLIAAPNPDAAQFATLRERWYHLDAPRHIYFLPRSLTRQIAESNGLSMERDTTTDRLGLQLDRLGWQAYLGEFCPIPGIRRAVKMVGSRALEAATGSRSEGRGAGYLMVFRRPDSTGGKNH